MANNDRMQGWRAAIEEGFNLGMKQADRLSVEVEIFSHVGREIFDRLSEKDIEKLDEAASKAKEAREALAEAQERIAFVTLEGS